MILTKILLVGTGGFIGSVARYGLGGLIHRVAGSTLPVGTLTVNVIGCFLIGILGYLTESQSVINPQIRAFIGIGVLGGFTTFSSFGYETMSLLQDGQVGFGMVNIAANIILGLAAVWLGRSITMIVGG